MKKFKVTLIEEKGFIKLHIRSLDFKNRIRKHVGKGSTPEFENYLKDFSKEIELHFEKKTATLESVRNFTEDYVEKMKHIDSIFYFTDEFIAAKQTTLNAKIEKYLSTSSINAYRRSIQYFREYLSKNRLSELPADINESVLNDFYHSLKPLGRNYRVKMHFRTKEYLKYLSEKKGVAIDKSYKNSTFTEQYDNQAIDDANDRSLTVEEMNKLIELRCKFKKGLIILPAYKKHKTIPEKLQVKQREQKLTNLERTLDCFLFMCGTGMYLADIEKTNISLNRVKNVYHITYRRVKNNSYCKGIVLDDYGCFCGKTLLQEYKISTGKNFPIKLSINHFCLNLRIISQLAGFDFKITSKMARKTFASILYFDYNLHINDIQSMLGHTEIKHTMHYLRITDDDFALRIHQQLKRTG